MDDFIYHGPGHPHHPCPPGEAHFHSGPRGKQGVPGVSPKVEVSEVGEDGKFTITVTDAYGQRTTEIPIAELTQLPEDIAEEIRDERIQEMVNAAVTSTLTSLETAAPEIISNATKDWLDDNVTPTGSAVAIDSSLTQSGLAADAKAAGDYIRSLEYALANAKAGAYSKAETDSAIAAYVVSFFERISSGLEYRKSEWHQCPESVRNFLAEAARVYPTADAGTTIVDQYAPRNSEMTEAVVRSNSKPIGYTIDGVTFYDNEPNVALPILTEHTMGTLTALDPVRWYNTTQASPATGGIYTRGINCRDLGGWSCDGGKIKYGQLVRSGELNEADTDLMVNKIGIRTEVQLLPVSEQADAYKKKAAWGIDWAGNDTENTTVYSPEDVSDPAKKALWSKILTDILDSIIYGKPVVFHCGAGADRTGVTAIVLMGILGVSRADIDTEYELTNFAIGWSSVSGNIYRGRSYPTYISMMDAFASVPLVGGLTDSFRNRCISFALSLGIPRAKINTFRRTVIDGSPEEIELADVYSVTTRLTHCTIDNTNTEVDEASVYTATLTQETGYTLKNATVEVTMGGVNVTSQYYSNGVISIPSVSGDIVITATAVALPNLFDSSAATYNARIRGVGAVSVDGNGTGRVVTGTLPISDVSTFMVKGITEVKASDNAYAVLGLYSSSEGGENDKVNVISYGSAKYSFDIASLKQQYPTAAYARLCFTLSTTAISTADTVDLEIYGA